MIKFGNVNCNVGGKMVDAVIVSLFETKQSAIRLKKILNIYIMRICIRHMRLKIHDDLILDSPNVGLSLLGISHYVGSSICMRNGYI